MERNKKFIIITIILSIIIVILAIALIYIIIDNKTIKGNIDTAIHAVINKDNTVFKFGNKEVELSKGERVSILKDDIINNNYLVKYEDKYGTINKENVSYFNFNENDTYSLMTDVSQFNIAENEEENTSRNFRKASDFELFILNNNINYVYIRLGGRGWGQKGVLYYDESAPAYIEACEYLGIPYGFYYLDEALNDDEITEEVEFVKTFLNENSTSMNLLPLVIDLEYQEGKGRADKIWEDRIPILNKLIESFKNEGIETLIYSNGGRIEKYIKSANSKFWAAYYPQDNLIPKNDYSTITRIEQLQELINNLLIQNGTFTTTALQETAREKLYSDEFLNKVIAWQFTENGAKESKVTERIDLSIVDNEHFKNYVMKNEE